MIKTCLRLLFLGAIALPFAHGCSDSPVVCLGTSVACANRDLSECNAGCQVAQGCFGDDVTCDSLTDDPMLCLQTGCRYIGTCEGEAGCATLSFETCGTTAGCVQVRRCYGSNVRCASLEESQCELYPECALGSRCQGSAASCDEVSTTSACLDVPGCFPADTTPSVVD